MFFTKFWDISVQLSSFRKKIQFVSCPLRFAESISGNYFLEMNGIVLSGLAGNLENLPVSQEGTFASDDARKLLSTTSADQCFANEGNLVNFFISEWFTNNYSFQWSTSLAGVNDAAAKLNGFCVINFLASSFFSSPRNLCKSIVS